jgi:hypothetical protein
MSRITDPLTPIRRAQPREVQRLQCSTANPDHRVGCRGKDGVIEIVSLDARS